MVTGAPGKQDAQRIARIGLKEADRQRDTMSSFFQEMKMRHMV